MKVERRRGPLACQLSALRDAEPVLAGHRAAQADGQREQVLGGSPGSVDLLGARPVHQERGVEVAVAGVSPRRRRKVVASSDLDRLLDRFCQPVERDGDVLADLPAALCGDADPVGKRVCCVSPSYQCDEDGGEIVCQGSLDDLLACEGSLTADYLTGRREIPLRPTRRKGSGKHVTVHGATANNLAGVTVPFPLGTFTCVTGVSGSGKSSLTIDTLYAGAARALNGARIPCGPCSKITGKPAGSPLS